MPFTDAFFRAGNVSVRLKQNSFGFRQVLLANLGAVARFDSLLNSEDETQIRLQRNAGKSVQIQIMNSRLQFAEYG